MMMTWGCFRRRRAKVEGGEEGLGLGGFYPRGFIMVLRACKATALPF